MKTPGVREVFLRVYPEAKEVTLGELRDPAVRRRLVQQMSTASANIPGCAMHPGIEQARSSTASMRALS